MTEYFVVRDKKFVEYAPIYTYKFVKWDWLSSEYAPGIRDLGFTKSGEPRDSLPCVFRMGEFDNPNNGHYVFLNKEWQFFTFDLLSMSYYNKTHEYLTSVEYDWLANRWAGLYHGGLAFTNNQGTDTNRNYITRKEDDMNLDAEKGIGLYTLICGGASITTIGDVQTNIKGKRVIRVNSFDGTKPPPKSGSINIYSDPRIFFACSITGTKVENGYKVRPFNFLQNPQSGEIKPVPIPIISNKPIYYLYDNLFSYPGIKRDNYLYP